MDRFTLNRFIALLALAAAPFLAFFWNAQESSSQPGASSGTPAKSGEIVAVTPDGVQSLRGQPAVAAPPPAPEWQQSVLPEVAGFIADWRAFRPETLLVRIDDALEARFRVTQVEENDGRTVLTARLATDPHGLPLDGSFLVATANASDRWDALVVLTGMEYRISVRPGSSSVEEGDSLAHLCATDASVDPGTANANGVSPSSAADNHTSLAIDVLFLYNQKALAERNQDTQTIDADCSNYIAASNAVLENSRIDTFRWRYAGVTAAPAYEDNDSTDTDLRAMRGTGAIAEFVTTNQRDYGADQVVLLVGGVKSDAVGRAWVGGSTAHSVVNYPFPTFNDGTRSSSTTSYTTTCHELGHNFGCRHQRNDPGTTASDGNGLYHYGHTFPRSPGETGTIMAVYVAPTTISRVPYFSNPELTYEGNALGVAADQPRAAFNARIMRETAAFVAGLIEEVAAPTITEQPRSVTASVGERVTLSVAATGGALTYSWTKDGTAIPPQSASFSIASATSASAGSYVVTVSNRKGTVTSQPAVLTISSPTTSTPPATGGGSSGGSGGSGGGATGIGWAIALLALGAARGRRR
jgi:hypothetical protein